VAARQGHGPVSGVTEGQGHGPVGAIAKGRGHGLAKAIISSATRTASPAASSPASSQLHLQLQDRYVDNVPWASYGVKDR
jgi:hypothetical protein